MTCQGILFSHTSLVTEVNSCTEIFCLCAEWNSYQAETLSFIPAKTDLQDDYMEALTRLHITVSKAYKVNPEMNFEVFIHKVDGLSDDHKIETQRDIHQRANDDLTDAGLEKLHLR